MKYLILGGGSVTGEFYLPALQRLGKLAQTTVVDPFERSLAPMRAAFGDALFVAGDFADYLARLAPGGDERVIVALPNRFHVQAVRQALGAGRHILCEKPLALHAAEGEALEALAQAHGRRLKVAMSRRYLPSLMLARQMVADGELGALEDVLVHDRMPFLWRPKSFDFFSAEGGGMLADMGVHYLDYIDTLVGPMSPQAYDDDAHGGIESSLTYDLAAGPAKVRLELSRLDQSGGFVRIRGARGELLIEKSDEAAVTLTRPGMGARRIASVQPFDDAGWPKSFHGSFCQMLVDFDRAVGGETTPIADVADAVRATRLIEWAYDHRPSGRARRLEKAEVVVTGATGFIGGHLVDRLAGAGQAVRVTARSPASLANVTRYPIELVRTDLLDPASARQAVAGMRTVYHLAYGKEADAPRITIEGTRNIVEAAIAEDCEAVVVLSTMYVFGFPGGDSPVDESFPYRPYGGEYATSKAEMERWCLDRAKTSGKTRIVVLNPTCVFGPGGGAYTQLPADLAAMGQWCWLDDGQGSANYTYVENTVDALLAAAATPQAHGERFIVNDGVTTWRDLLTPFVAPLGSQWPSYSLDEFNQLPRYGGPFRWKDLAQAIVNAPPVRQVIKRSPTGRRLFDRASQSARAKGQSDHYFSWRAQAEDTPPTYPPIWLAELFSPAKASFSSAKAARVLGWTPRVPLAQAQAESVAWLVHNGRLPAPPN